MPSKIRGSGHQRVRQTAASRRGHLRPFRLRHHLIDLLDLLDRRADPVRRRRRAGFGRAGSRSRRRGGKESTVAEQNERGKSPAARGRGLMKALWAALTLVAVITELRKPKDERTWHGTVLGFVPYDLRFPPTWARFRASLWSPDD